MRATSLVWLVSILSLAANAIPIPDTSSNSTHALEARDLVRPPVAKGPIRRPTKAPAPVRAPIRQPSTGPVRAPARRPTTPVKQPTLPGNGQVRPPTTKPGTPPVKKPTKTPAASCTLKKKPARKPTTKPKAPRSLFDPRRIIDYVLSKRALLAQFATAGDLPDCDAIKLDITQPPSSPFLVMNKVATGSSRTVYQVEASSPEGFENHFVKAFIGISRADIGNMTQEIALNTVLGLHVAHGPDTSRLDELKKEGKQPATYMLLRPQQGEPFIKTKFFSTLSRAQCEALLQPGGALRDLVSQAANDFIQKSQGVAGSASGFFHGDLQPDNIFFTENAAGTALTKAFLIDPGLAQPAPVDTTVDPNLTIAMGEYDRDCSKRPQ